MRSPSELCAGTLKACRQAGCCLARPVCFGMHLRAPACRPTALPAPPSPPALRHRLTQRSRSSSAATTRALATRWSGGWGPSCGGGPPGWPHTGPTRCHHPHPSWAAGWAAMRVECGSHAACCSHSAQLDVGSDAAKCPRAQSSRPSRAHLTCRPSPHAHTHTHTCSSLSLVAPLWCVAHPHSLQANGMPWQTACMRAGSTGRWQPHPTPPPITVVSFLPLTLPPC